MSGAADGKTDGQGRYIGRPMPRFEDLRLVRGAGRFTDDITLDEQAFAVFVRSQHAHAHIGKIDAEAARCHPGVLAVLTGADYQADGLAGIRQVPIPAEYHDHTKPAFVGAPERPILDEPHFPLAMEYVRFVGEAVAVVVADTLLAARDAAELVHVVYDVLPSVSDVVQAVAPDAPSVWRSAPDNIALDVEFGDRDAVTQAMASSDLVVEQVFRNQRIAIAQMEPRAAIGSYNPVTGDYTLIAGNQGVHRVRQALAACLKAEPARVRVICPDVGGAFGARTNLQPEQIIVAWAAKRLGRPVKWTSDRSEAFLTDFQGRDVVTTGRLGFGRDGRIRAFALEFLSNVGAQTITYVPLNNGYHVAPTVYDIPLLSARVRAVMTNTVPTAPYRGAGRPEATVVIERLLDMAAGRLKLDRAEVRRRNLIRQEALPYRTATGLTYDSGDFLGNMDRVLTAADWAGFPARRARAAKQGRLLGIGLANYVETPVGAPHERVAVTVSAEGFVELITGTQSNGQGHETTFAQVMADQLGVEPTTISLVTGDTTRVASGGGTHSDRTMRIAGALMVEASTAIVAKARAVAAWLLQADSANVVFEDGLFQAAQSNRRLNLFEIAQNIAENAALPVALREPLTAEAKFTGRMPAYPTGSAVCELEVDPQTGAIRFVRYCSIDDAGQPINPLIVHGQTHGGIVQGLGQALLEQVVFAPDTAQVLTGSFVDYAMPRADIFPPFEIELTEHPTKGNPLRVKGGGEGGITPSPAAAINAVIDALSGQGVEHMDMPATPDRVWAVLQAARHSG